MLKQTKDVGKRQTFYSTIEKQTQLLALPQSVSTYCLVDLKILTRWAQEIVNHLYWSIFTCLGNGKSLVERLSSLQQHILNKHKFPNIIHYKRCKHEALSEDDAKEWPEIGSESHEKLRTILCEKTLLANLENMRGQCQK